MTPAGCLAAAALAVALASCRGPAPRVVGQAVRVAPDAQSIRVEAVIANAGDGSGQVAVAAVVLERGSGSVLARASQEVELEPRGSQAVVIEVPLAVGLRSVDPTRLDVRVEATYPVQ